MKNLVDFYLTLNIGSTIVCFALFIVSLFSGTINEIRIYFFLFTFLLINSIIFLLTRNLEH